MPPGHLRSEISFSRACNVTNLISHIYGIALLRLKHFIVGVSTWLCNFVRMVVHGSLLVCQHGCACARKQTSAQRAICLQGTTAGSNNRDHPTRLLYCRLCAPLTCGCYSYFFAHIPFAVHRAFNANREAATMSGTEPSPDSLQQGP